MPAKQNTNQTQQDGRGDLNDRLIWAIKKLRIKAKNKVLSTEFKLFNKFIE
jgi:hypothetical protein